MDHLGIVALAALAATLAPAARAAAGGVAAGLSISGVAVGALGMRLTAPRTGAAAAGGCCDAGIASGNSSQQRRSGRSLSAGTLIVAHHAELEGGEAVQHDGAHVCQYLSTMLADGRMSRYYGITATGPNGRLPRCWTYLDI